MHKPNGKQSKSKKITRKFGNSIENNQNLVAFVQTDFEFSFFFFKRFSSQMEWIWSFSKHFKQKPRIWWQSWFHNVQNSHESIEFNLPLVTKQFAAKNRQINVQSIENDAAKQMNEMGEAFNETFPLSFSVYSRAIANELFETPKCHCKI